MADEKKINTDTPVDETPIPAAVPEETPPAEEAAVKHKYDDRLAKAYPDKKFATDEQRDAAMEEHLNDLEGYKEKGQVSNKKLIELFEREPAAGDVVRDCINGMTFREALARHLDPADLTAIEGDPDYEGMAKNKTEFAEKSAKNKEFQDTYAKNISTSEQAVTAFVEKKGMDEAAADAFFQKFDGMLDDIKNGKITEAHLEEIAKAFSYDTDVVAATEQGKIAGRNENIVAKKEATTATGDGLPRPTRSAQEPEPAKHAPNYMDEMVAKTKKKDAFAS